jgi:hypothetical protein
MSLAGLPTGCYYLRITAGTGITQETHISDWQYISSVPLDDTVMMEYWHNRFHEDVMFEQG